ncbi:MAG: ATP-binding protein [Phormidesmis sp.]
MRTGSQRVSEIVQSLRNFSRLDEAKFKAVDSHEGLDATLMILQSRFNANHCANGIELIRAYGKLPLVDCAPGPLNQVFINLLSNAIDALEETATERSHQQANPRRIWICTEHLCDNQVAIRIKDNGSGIPAYIQDRIFDPFFTTKPVGKGTGLGLSVSYQTIESHGGRIDVKSNPEESTEFIISLPVG